MSEEYSAGYSEGHDIGRNQALDECIAEIDQLRADNLALALQVKALKDALIEAAELCDAERDYLVLDNTRATAKRCAESIRRMAEAIDSQAADIEVTK